MIYVFKIYINNSLFGPQYHFQCCFFCMNEFDDEFLFLTERPLFAAFILLLLRPFLLLEQIEGSLIVMHQKFKRGFDLQKGLRK